MDLVVFISVLFSACIQASWNFFAKKSSANKTVLLIVGWLLFGLITLPIALVFTDVSKLTQFSFGFIALSGFIHFIYVLLLGWAYTIGEISVVYPIARGVGVALTALISSVLGWDQISYFGAIGIIAVAFGTLMVGLHSNLTNKSFKDVKIAVLVGLAISMYSLVDSQGVKHIEPFFFIAAINLVPAVFAIPLLLGRFKKDFLKIVKTKKVEALIIATMGSLAYVIVLWAFSKSQASYVVALREFSIVFATLLGIVLLKESITTRKIFGIFTIVFGLILIKWSM